MNFTTLTQRLTQGPQRRIGLIGADDPASLTAVAAAHAAGLATATLYGDPTTVAASAERAAVDLSPFTLHPCPSAAASTAAALASATSGAVDLLMKGHVDTPTLMGAAVSASTGFRRGGLMSHLAALEIPRQPRLLFLTDTGLNPYPRLAEKRDIAHNALAALRRLGLDRPAMAILSATEVETPKLPCSVDAAQLCAEAHRGDLGPCECAGPVDVFIATDPAAAAIKGVACPIAGRTDLWLLPDMVSGNILTKSLVTFAQAKLGGVILGGACPIVLASRASSAGDKERSILLALAVAATA